MDISQQTFVCSKLKLETLEKAVNMFKVNNIEIITTSLTLFWCLLLTLLLHLFLGFLLLTLVR